MRCILQGEAWVHFVMESKFIVQVSQVNDVISQFGFSMGGQFELL